MSKNIIDGGTIVKLAVWSLIVGFILFSMDVSPADFYGWLINKLAGMWEWAMEFGLQYMLVGASIVVPIFIFMVLKNRSKS